MGNCVRTAPREDAGTGISSCGELSEEGEDLHPGIIPAYYSALTLLQLVESVVVQHKYKLLLVDIGSVNGLKDKLHSWMTLLEKLPSRDVNPGIKSLCQRFIDCGFNWRNIIDYHVLDQKMRDPDLVGDEFDRAIFAINGDIDVLIQELELVTQRLTNGSGECRSLTITNEAAVLLPYDKTQQTPLVRIELPVQRMREGLMNGIRDRQVITIVGMGGSGKTTLARCVYEDSVVRKHFDRHYWITVSQACDVRKILQNLLEDKNTHEISVLGTRLHHEIVDQRYLIVLDDLWSIHAWEELVVHFSNNTKGSRIIVTTRESRVAASLSPTFSHRMDLLDEEASWDLLSKKVFFGEHCPDELQEVGRDIARNCKGLPISIVTISGLLSKYDMTLQVWRFVATNLTSLVGLQDDEHCMKILSLSYHYMPLHLKLCFLSLTFYNDDVAGIDVGVVIQQWIVDSIVKPEEGRGIEDVALDYLKDLIERNMIFVRRFDEIMGIKTLVVHDLLLELCRKELSIENVCTRGTLDITITRCVGCSITYFMEFHDTDPMNYSKISCYGRIFHQLRTILPSSPSNSAHVCLKCKKFELREHFCSRMMHPTLSSSNKSICEVNVPHFHGVDKDVIYNFSNYHFSGSLLWNVQMHAHDAWHSYEMMPQLKFSAFVPTVKEGVIFDQLIEVDESLYWDNVHGNNILGFRYFRRHSLRRLGICHATIDEHGIRAIKNLPYLEHLVFHKCILGTNKWCGYPPGFRRLKYLGISAGKISSLLLGEFAFPQLVTLWLRCVDFRFTGYLSNISSFQSIRVDSCGRSVVDSAIETLNEKRRAGDERFYLKIDGRLLGLQSENENCFSEFENSDAKKEDEFSLFETMMMSLDRFEWYNYSDVIEYQRRLQTWQQLQHLVIFGKVGRGEMVEWPPTIAFRFPNLKVIRELRQWGGFPLPSSLKRLLLQDALINDSRTKTLMELHHLEELVFFYCTFENEEWCSLSEGEFSRLKHLKFAMCPTLVYLKVGEELFPQLRTLAIDSTQTMRISHDDICGISSLSRIRIQSCGALILKSAKKILKQRRRDWGDEDFYVEVQNEQLVLEEEQEDDDDYTDDDAES